MKQIKITAFIFFAALLFCSSSVVYASSTTDIVYKTPHGIKYHTKNCQYIKDDCIVITLGVAYREGYEPCKVCNPPTLTAIQIADLDKNIAEQKPFDASKLFDEDKPETGASQQAVETIQSHDDNAISIEWLISTAIALVILICICLYISDLKKQLRKKDNKIHDLETELKISQVKIETMKELQNQSNHTKEENS